MRLWRQTEYENQERGEGGWNCSIRSSRNSTSSRDAPSAEYLYFFYFSSLVLSIKLELETGLGKRERGGGGRGRGVMDESRTCGDAVDGVVQFGVI